MMGKQKFANSRILPTPKQNLWTESECQNIDLEISNADDIRNGQSDFSHKSELDEDNLDDIPNDEKELEENSSPFLSETRSIAESKSRELKLSPSFHSNEINPDSKTLVLPEISVKLKGENKCIVGKRIYNTCDDVASKKESADDREKRQKVLNQCAEVIKIPKNSFLPEIPMSGNDEICYAAVVDRRYNRWKRRRKIRTRVESVTPVKPASPCESSPEDIKDTTPVRESPPVTLKLRRRKHNDKGIPPAATSHQLHYDDSSEIATASDKDIHHSMYAPKEYIHSKSSAKDSIEEQQSRINAAVEETTKESLQMQMDIFDRQSQSVTEEAIDEDFESAILQARSVPLAKKRNVSPPLVSPSLSGQEERSKIKPPNLSSFKTQTSTLPTFKTQTSTYNKCVYLQNDGNNFPKPLERSLVFHASSDAGSSVLKYIVHDESAGKSRGQSTGLVKIRMDKNAKERLLMSKIAHNKSIGSSRPLSDNTMRKAAKSMSLNHLLQTIQTPSKVNDNDNKSKKNKMCSQSDDEMLSPSIVSLQPKSNSDLQETMNKTPRENPKIDRKKCIAVKNSSVVSLRKQNQARERKTLDFRTYGETRSGSSQTFTPAFTYSLFELPEIYRKYNEEIERRASLVCLFEGKYKQGL